MTPSKRTPSHMYTISEFLSTYGRCEVGEKAPTIGFLDEATVGIDPWATALALLLSEPKDVLQSIEGDLHNLWIHHSQQVAQRFDAAQGDQVPEGQRPGKF